MKPELIITQAWQQKKPWLKLLRPLSHLYQHIDNHNKQAYQLGKKSQYKAPVPVLVIGNITVGGSGKTPLLIALVKLLQGRGIRVGVISRGYGGNEKIMPALVHAQSTPSEVGDEPCLIVSETSVPMAVCPNRGQAIDLLIKNYPTLQLIISDDGLQHYALHRDVEWIVVDVERGFGNGKLLPEGFLREPISRLDNATVIYHYANQDQANQSPHANTMFLKLGKLSHLTNKNKIFDPINKKIHALTGIGYPIRFFNTLKSLGFEPIEHPKPDHHRFAIQDIIALQTFPIVVTAKDATKLMHLMDENNADYFDNIWVLPVEAVLSDGVYGEMDRVLASFDVLTNC